VNLLADTTVRNWSLYHHSRPLTRSTPMANKAAKSLAVRNAAALKQMHIITLLVHSIFLFSRAIRFHSITLRSFGVYLLISVPAAMFEFWFEKNSRPTYNSLGDLETAGDDLEAKGLTQYFHDVLIWTHFTIAMSAVFGNKAMWLWAVVPVYSVYAAFKAYGGVKDAMGGLTGSAGQPDSGDGAQSNRQKKLEKRGGQKVQYR
jgi:hypothetical protein